MFPCKLSFPLLPGYPLPRGHWDRKITPDHRALWCLPSPPCSARPGAVTYLGLPVWPACSKPQWTSTASCHPTRHMLAQALSSVTAVGAQWIPAMVFLPQRLPSRGVGAFGHRRHICGHLLSPLLHSLGLRADGAAGKVALWTLLLSLPTGLLPLQGSHTRACLMLISGLLCMKEECMPPQSLFSSHPGPMPPVLARSALPGCPSSQDGGQIRGSILTSSRKPSLTAVDN